MYDCIPQCYYTEGRECGVCLYVPDAWSLCVLHLLLGIANKLLPPSVSLRASFLTLLFISCYCTQACLLPSSLITKSVGVSLLHMHL